MPIASRELVVAARRPSTYLVRIVAVLIGGGIMAMQFWSLSERSMPAAAVGKVVFFLGLLWCWVLCFLSGCILTSDCISEERRDGTLGFLFLTPLKAADVALGKLAARSLTGIYGVVAMVPVFAISLLWGGITLEQFGSGILLLFLTLAVSLAAGLCISAISQNQTKAVFYTLLLLLGITLLPFLLCYVLNDLLEVMRAEHFWKIAVASPAFMYLSLSGGGMIWPAHLFWVGCLATGGWSLLFLVLACVRVKAGMRATESLDLKIRQKRAVRHSCNENPVEWMRVEGQGNRAVIWIFVWSLFAIWGVAVIRYGKMVLHPEALGPFVLVINGFVKFWLVSEICSRVWDQKRSGGFEMLLTTPLGTRGIVEGLRKATSKRFDGPIVALAGMESISLLVYLEGFKGSEFVRIFPSSYEYFLGLIILLLIHRVSLFWVGSYLALRCRTRGGAILLTMFIVLALPEIFFGMMHLYPGRSLPGYLISYLIINFGLVCWGEVKLQGRFRQLVAEKRW